MKNTIFKTIAASMLAAVMAVTLMAGIGFASETEETEAQAPAYDYLVLVNKTHKLPDDWESTVVLDEAENSYGETYLVETKALESFLALQEALREEDVYIELDSTYRSVAQQQKLWDDWTVEYGEDYVKTYVAVPGFSEHHTGLAIDICLVVDGERVNDNDEMLKEEEIFSKVHELLPEYGFILRYLDGKEDITGYGYEPWHLRYIDDPELAKEITDMGITFEEYLGAVPAAQVAIDYGTSDIYTDEDMEEAIAAIREEFDTWEGCVLHSIRYASDECMTDDNLQWMNALEEDKNYTQCISFVSDFHSPEDEFGSWEPDTEYQDWQWWLARTEDGSWELITWGY